MGGTKGDYIMFQFHLKQTANQETNQSQINRTLTFWEIGLFEE